MSRALSRTPWRRKVRAAAPPAVAVGLILVAAILPGSGEQARTPGPVEVERSSFACPAGSGIRVTAGQVVPGTSATARTLPDRDPVEALEDAAAWRSATVAARGVIVEQAGRGSGVSGWFSGRAPKASGAGLVIGPCPTVVDDAWYLGAGTGTKHASTLVLTNTSASTAVVDLEFLGAAGPVKAIDATGIVVDPYSTTRVALDDLAAGEEELAVHLHRRRGAVTAVMTDASTAIFHGSEVIEPVGAPEERVLIGGLVTGSGGRTLLLANPGERTARVSVDVFGAEGRFTPEGLADLKVEAGSIRSVAVPSSVGRTPVGLEVRSDQAIVASVRLSPTRDDHAYAEAGAVLDGPALVPVIASAGAPRLIVTAPGEAAQVTVVAWSASMKQLGKGTLEVAPGATVEAALAKIAGVKGAAGYVVTTQGQVFGTATYAGGGRLASIVLRAAPVVSDGPRVRSAS